MEKIDSIAHGDPCKQHVAVEECSICFEPIKDNDTKSSPYTCLHVFHERCTRKWLKSQRQGCNTETCPLCRSECKQDHCTLFTTASSNINMIISHNNILRTNTHTGFRDHQVKEVIDLFGEENVTQDSVSVMTIKLPVSHSKIVKLCKIIFKTNTIIIGRYSNIRKHVTHYTKSSVADRALEHIVRLYACLNTPYMTPEYYKGQFSQLRHAFYTEYYGSNIVMQNFVLSAYEFCNLYMRCIDKHVC